MVAVAPFLEESLTDAIDDEAQRLDTSDQSHRLEEEVEEFPRTGFAACLRECFALKGTLLVAGVVAFFLATGGAAGAR